MIKNVLGTPSFLYVRLKGSYFVFQLKTLLNELFMSQGSLTWLVYRPLFGFGGFSRGYRSR